MGNLVVHGIVSVALNRPGTLDRYLLPGLRRQVESLQVILIAGRAAATEQNQLMVDRVVDGRGVPTSTWRSPDGYRDLIPDWLLVCLLRRDRLGYRQMQTRKL